MFLAAANDRMKNRIVAMRDQVDFDDVMIAARPIFCPVFFPFSIRIVTPSSIFKRVPLFTCTSVVITYCFFRVSRRSLFIFVFMTSILFLFISPSAFIFLMRQRIFHKKTLFKAVYGFHHTVAGSLYAYSHTLRLSLTQQEYNSMA